MKDIFRLLKEALIAVRDANDAVRRYAEFELAMSKQAAETPKPVQPTPEKKEQLAELVKDRVTGTIMPAPVPSGSKRFKKPTVSEVKAYAAERGLPESEACRFHDYHESRGWKVGKNPMKDWQAAFRTWERNWRQRNPQAVAVPDGAKKEFHVWLKNFREKHSLTQEELARSLFDSGLLPSFNSIRTVVIFIGRVERNAINVPPASAAILSKFLVKKFESEASA